MLTEAQDCLRNGRRKLHKLIVCDFDGTLVKLDVDWEALKKRLNEEMNTEAFDNLDKGLRKLRMVDEESFKRVCEQISGLEISGFTRVNDELIEKVREYENFAIFTSNTRRATFELTRKRDFRGLTPFIVAKEDVKNGKPSHEGLNFIKWWFDLPVSEIIFYGNSEEDRLAGERAGIETVILE